MSKIKLTKLEKKKAALKKEASGSWNKPELETLMEGIIDECKTNYCPDAITIVKGNGLIKLLKTMHAMYCNDNGAEELDTFEKLHNRCTVDRRYYCIHPDNETWLDLDAGGEASEDS